MILQTRGIASSLGSRATQDQLPEAVGITFTGQAFVDGPNVTLFGSVEQVYNELLKINPAYDPWEFQDYRERMEGLGFSNRHAFDEKKAVSFTSEAQDEKRSLAKRDAVRIYQNLMNCQDSNSVSISLSATLMEIMLGTFGRSALKV